ncbi:hypothetical protein RA19_23275 [Leisingera sp. ANG-M1]|uniref:hypothetical protein n=1 Tax=Leisingera sp. ANG-M1 TaxID=1577895 RepID=UPI00057D1F2E|nr:hypothetical protein [Leisingera sp. ANG-M1]KIC07701.1 hypothetical protein RA19_23275 [Leisingera sp. ANG-M1]
MKSLNRHQITLFGTQALLDWLKSVKPELRRWDLRTLNHRPSAYLIEMEDQNCHGLVLEKHFKKVVEQELSQSLYVPKEHWPSEITFELFRTWFFYQYHEEVYDLSSDELLVFDD